jgi:hypothetical protein
LGVTRQGTINLHRLLAPVEAGGDEMVRLFWMPGPIEYIGSDGQVDLYRNGAETKLAKYTAYCEASGLALAPILG